MTEYDLETKKALRRVSLLEYGFGPETLRGRKICPACGRGNGRLPDRLYLLRRGAAKGDPL